MTKREQRILAAKKREWDLAASDIDRFFDRLRIIMKKVNKDIKYNANSWLDSYFHDKDLKKMDKFMHRFWVTFINLFIFWVLINLLNK